VPENYDAVVMTSHRTREAAHRSIRNYQSDELYQFRRLTLHYAKIIHGYIITMNIGIIVQLAQSSRYESVS
jgi:hypothetical protein